MGKTQPEDTGCRAALFIDEAARRANQILVAFALAPCFIPRAIDAKTILLVVLSALVASFAVFWVAALVSAKRRARGGATGPGDDVRPPTLYGLFVGAVTDFFDALGIGSFATTTTLFRFRREVPDRVLPGTLNVGHALPTFCQALVFVTGIAVETTTLVSMIAAAVLGAWLGAGIICRWPKRKVQVGMGAALLAAAGIMFGRQFGDPVGGDAIGLEGGMLAAGIAGNFALGALMTIGIGLYAPCMILVSMLGMSSKTAFPIMMGSCAFLMPIASIRFIRSGAYDVRASLGLALGGIPATLAASLLVKDLDLAVVRWLVIVVVVYTAITMLVAASRRPTDGEPPRTGP